LNIQTERLEDQTARVTVEIDSERLDAAKQKAARQISTKVNIPGFRKGKVPYRVLVNYVGEPAILEEAVELLGQEVYQEMLPQTGLLPFGPGTLTDVKTDQATPSFIYIVPLQPSVDLKGYRDIRAPYEVPETTDEDVTRAMKNLQEQQAVVEDSNKPAELGNKVTLDLHSYILETHEDEAETEEADAEEAEADSEVSDELAEEAADEHDHDHDEDEEHDHDHDHVHDHGHAHGGEDEGTPYIHEHGLQLVMDEDDEPQPGFNDALVGASVGDTKIFVLTFPDDAEKYQDMAGKTVRYYVDVKKVENMTLPALTDEFAARVTKDDEKPLDSLLDLRIRVRENLTTLNADNYKTQYVRKALDQIVDQAEAKFPEAMIADQVDRFLQDFDQRLRQQGITLQDYMKIYQKTQEDLYNDYRANAEQTVRRSLVLGEIAEVEQLTVTDEQIAEQVEKIVSQFDPERQDTIRQMFSSQPTMRDSVRSDILRDEVLDRIAEIARGEAPVITNPIVLTTPEEPQPQTQSDEVTTETKEESA
jgi:trigger factor